VRAEVKDAVPLKHDYLAYFGRYEIDTGKQVVRHFLEGQLFAWDHPAVLERKYRFDGDLMPLRPEDRTYQEILWQRVRENPQSESSQYAGQMPPSLRHLINSLAATPLRKLS
jgi:hypothetical protein